MNPCIILTDYNSLHFLYAFFYVEFKMFLMKVLVSWFYILGLNVTEALLMSNALSKILCSKNVRRKERKKGTNNSFLFFLTLTIKRSRVTLIFFIKMKKKKRKSSESPFTWLDVIVIPPFFPPFKYTTAIFFIWACGVTHGYARGKKQWD